MMPTVMCTAPNKYTVVDPEGSIKPHCCIDIVVRHNATISSNCNVTDKFRIQMQDLTTKQVPIARNNCHFFFFFLLPVREGIIIFVGLLLQVIGKRDVTARLVPGTNDASSDRERDNFQQLPLVSGAQSPQQQQYLVRDGRTGEHATSVHQFNWH